MMIVAYLLALVAATTVPDVPVADRCAMIGTVLERKAKMPMAGMRTVDVRLPDIAGVRKRVEFDGRPAVKADWHVGRDYHPIFVPSPRATCGGTTFALLLDGPEQIHDARELVLLVTITPLAIHPTRFAFEEKLGRNPQFRFAPSVGGIAIPAVRYSGVVEKGPAGNWTAVVTDARFAE
jgi:hypothetical protein